MTPRENFMYWVESAPRKTKTGLEHFYFNDGLGIDVSCSLEIVYNEVRNDTEKGKEFLKALGWV